MELRSAIVGPVALTNDLCEVERIPTLPWGDYDALQPGCIGRGGRQDRNRLFALGQRAHGVAQRNKNEREDSKTEPKVDQAAFGQRVCSRIGSSSWKRSTDSAGIRTSFPCVRTWTAAPAAAPTIPPKDGAFTATGRRADKRAERGASANVLGRLLVPSEPGGLLHFFTHNQVRLPIDSDTAQTKLQRSAFDAALFLSLQDHKLDLRSFRQQNVALRIHHFGRDIALIGSAFRVRAIDGLIGANFERRTGRDRIGRAFDGNC